MPRGRSAKATPDVVRGYEVSFAGELWRVEFVPSGGAGGPEVLLKQGGRVAEDGGPPPRFRWVPRKQVALSVRFARISPRSMCTTRKWTFV